MATAYRTNGTATITVDGSTLGVSTADGVNIEESQHQFDVYSDERGPQTPAEIINLGTEAIISGTFAKYDDTVLQAFIAKRQGGTFGSMGTIGDLMFLGSRTSTVVIASPIDGHAQTFNRCILTKFSRNVSIGNITTADFEIRAVPDASGVVSTRA